MSLPSKAFFQLKELSLLLQCWRCDNPKADAYKEEGKIFSLLSGGGSFSGAKDALHCLLLCFAD